jgi:hypothetical protein
MYYIKNNIIFLFLLTIPIKAQTMGGIEIHSSATVHFIITNPQGYQTGYDSRGKSPVNYSGFSVKRDIPNSSYGFGGIGSLDSSDNDTEGMECLIGDIFENNATGTYHLLLIGTQLNTFWVDIWLDKWINGV